MHLQITKPHRRRLTNEQSEKIMKTEKSTPCGVLFVCGRAEWFRCVEHNVFYCNVISCVILTLWRFLHFVQVKDVCKLELPE